MTKEQIKYYKTDKGKLLRKKSDKNYLKKIRQGAISVLGGKCVRCGFTDIRALQIDHINGGGSKDVKRRGRGGQFYNQVMNSFLNKENEFQLLCANCNWIKRVENNEVRKSCVDIIKVV